MRHRTPQFATFFERRVLRRYYSYLWADTLTADAYEAFKEGRGPRTEVARGLEEG